MSRRPLSRALGPICAIFVCALTAVGWAEPLELIITNARGYPQIDIARTERSCAQFGLNDQTRQRIIDAAAVEWSFFRFPRYVLTKAKTNVIPPGLSPDAKRTRRAAAYVARLSPIGFMEDDPEVRARIGTYWTSVEFRDVFESQNRIWQLSGGQAGWVQHWSAAFISYVMCNAGLVDSEFVRSAAHRTYIRAALEHRDGLRPGYAYTAYDLDEATPTPGDLICAADEDDQFTIDRLADFRTTPAHLSYHCDIVVGFDVTNTRKAGLAYAIGGNVINAVSLTETPMANGRLVKVRVPRGRNWFAILKLDRGAGKADFRRVPREVVDRAEGIGKTWSAAADGGRT